MEFTRRLGVIITGFSSTPFVTSWLFPGYMLASIRLVFSVYCFTTIFYSWAWFASHDVTFHLKDIGIPKITFSIGAAAIGQSFSYFTYLSYWGMAFYFAFAGMHTFVYARRRATWLDKWPLLLQVLHSIFYSSVVCLPFLVTSVYWGSMWVGSWFETEFDSWSMTSIHILNSVFAAFEIIFTQTAPLPWLHLPALLGIMALYLGIAYLSKVTIGIYIYLWLDPRVGVTKIIAHVVGYTMSMIVIFNLARGAIWLRCCLTRARRVPPEHLLNRADNIDSSNRDTLPQTREIELRKTASRRANLEALTFPFQSTRVSIEAPTISRTSFDRTTIDPNDLPQPEPIYRPHPRRSSSYHIQNFSRPQSMATSVMSKSTKHSGFWV